MFSLMHLTWNLLAFMNLRFKFTLYLIFIHLLFAGVAIYLLSKHRLWLVAIEVIFVISLAIGIKLIGNLFGTLELVNTGAQFIQDSDFTTRFREVGQPEMNRLVQVYNRMADNLREERVRLQEQNYFLEKVLTASPSGIMTFDFDGGITLLNPAAERMLQAPGAELVGKRLGELQIPFAAALNGLRRSEAQILPLAGRRRVKCRRSHFLDRGFTRDFILMEELTEELRQTEKTAYEKVIRLMSHEVNNSVGSANSLLYSCLNYSDQLDSDDRSDFENALRVVIARTDQLNSFMRSFAEVFRLPPPALQPCDLRQQLEEIALLFQSECAQRRIELRWETEPTLDEIRLDRRQMDHVFVNILKNAIEAIGKNGVITIRLGMQKAKNFAEIEDTGCGISDLVRVNLFTPFFSTKEHGQGIGLTLVQEVLDAHEFDFSLESRPGEPTKFRIYF
ncbi:MAG: ATP-binding protein [Acidobacteria bacterium]|nr:ATP-binding protein [Acidobacteriota bacterium]